MAAIQGDWHTGRQLSDGTVRYVYATQPDGREEIVAKAWSDGDGDYESTARLISAAPDLLRELKFAVRVVKDYHISRGVAAALAAIRKAEGGDAKVVEAETLCCICGGPIAAVNGWRDGHNAQPVSDGRCCDTCNQNVVIPARLAEFDKRRNKS